MQWDEYLKHFFVSSAYCLIIANEIQAILFTCELDKMVYLENITYNNEYSKYGVGIVLYYHLINDLIERGKTVLYLGDGYQEYKRRFCGENQLVFDGFICRNDLIKMIKLIKQTLVKAEKSIRRLLRCF
jgi:CelD/BcsL family acetyltransferase involved in cellulose biosynthesis